CSDLLSIPAAQDKISASTAPWYVITSLIVGFPKVSVLVLSKAMALIFASSSRKRPHLIRMPFFEALPTAEKMDIGVDITKAQGQAITSSVMARSNHILKS